MIFEFTIHNVVYNHHGVGSHNPFPPYGVKGGKGG